ncbi:Alpha-L-fucosidase [Planctomycetes bacterium MalM25]|nr:Alpha-L-fucosidase [Planctomycetes bacterium MalM25]
MRKLSHAFMALLAAACCTVVSAKEPLTTAGPYAATGESLQQWETPAWFRDAKFGIFIHWGPYAVPAYGSEWYPRRMYQEHRTTPKGVVSKKPDPLFKHHREAWGDQGEFGYKDFVPNFHAENWKPEEWIDLFKRSGAKYVVPVAEHHDGFAMYGSSHTPWNSVEKGPKRDIIGDLGEACRAGGLRFGVSSHYAWNWRYYTYRDDFDTSDPANAALYGRAHDPDAPADAEFLAHWLARTAEIIDKYQPEVLWFDFGLNYPEFTDVRTQLAAYYYNRGLQNDQEVVLQYKNMNWNPFPEGSGLLDIERGKFDKINGLPWQTDTSVSSRSWGYIEDDAFKSSADLVDNLIDIVSKNGCMLLNVGPRPDGTIPQAAQDVLLEMGAWLDVYGEAIYGTRPWKEFGEGPTSNASGHHSEKNYKDLTPEDFRFTQKDGVVYAIGMAWPDSGEASVRSLGAGAGLLDGAIASVELVGSDAPLEWDQGNDALTVKLPAGHQDEPAYALRIKTKESP